MIELRTKLPGAQWGITHLRISNDKGSQEISLKCSDGRLAKRFFKVCIAPKKATISIESSSINMEIKAIRIFRVSQNFASKRAITKLTKSNSEYQDLSANSVIERLESLASKNDLSANELLYNLYDQTVFPPVYGRENNLKSFLGLGLPLPTGKLFGNNDTFDKNITVTLHVYYPNMMQQTTKYLQNIPFCYTLLVTTDNAEKKALITTFFQEHKQANLKQLIISITPNRGRNIGPLLIELGPSVLECDYMLHIHSKKSPYGDETEGWFDHCMSHLLDSQIYIASILDLLESSNNGILYPPPLPSISEHLHWETMKPKAEALLRKLNIDPNLLSAFPLEFPAGAMFWCKPSAIEPLLKSGISWDDFPLEEQQRNGTLAHAIERLFLYIAFHQGFDFKAVRPAQKYSYFRPLLTSFSQNEAIATIENPKFSILIPAYNNWGLTKKCILSIIDYTDSLDTPFELILADDNSSDETKSANNIFPGIIHVKSDKNIGFLENCNQAAKFAKGKYLVLLNNDTQVQPDWLSSINKIFEEKEDAGIVGAKLVYPDGTLQEAGGVIWKDANGLNYGGKDHPDSPPYSYVKKCDYISGAAICIKKELWNKLDGFDQQFAPAYYEDTDLCFAVRKLGYEVYFQPGSVVIHNEGGSHGTDLNSGIKKYQLVNQEKFFNKWSKVLLTEHRTGEDLMFARERSVGKKIIAVIDHFLPEYDRHAGARHTLCYINLLLSKGYIVKYFACFINHERQLHFASHLEQLGVETFYPKTYHFEHSWGEWILSNREYLSAVLINRPHIFRAHIDACQKAGLPVLYMCHDIHNLRAYREAVAIGNQQLAKRISSQEWEEIEIFKKADFSYTPSLYELDYLRTNKAIENIAYIPLYFSKHTIKRTTASANSKQVIFVGGMKHAPNKSAVLWFIEEIWPIVIKLHPEACFRVIGAEPSEHLLRHESDSIKFLGGITEDQLDQEYLCARATVAPLKYGAGVKGKTLESLQRGLPTVLTDIASEGIPELNSIIQSKNTHSAFAEELIRILSLGEEDWLELSHEYQSFFEYTFSEELAWRHFKVGLEHIALLPAKKKEAL